MYKLINSEYDDEPFWIMDEEDWCLFVIDGKILRRSKGVYPKKYRTSQDKELLPEVYKYTLTKPPAHNFFDILNDTGLTMLRLTTYLYLFRHGAASRMDKDENGRIVEEHV